MAKPDIFTAFKIHYKLMRISGNWPLENPTAFYKLRKMGALLIMVALVTTMLMEVFHNITDVAKLSDILYICITVLAGLIKYAIFCTKEDTFLYTMNLLKDPTFLSYPDELDYLMINSISFLKLLVQMFMFFIYVCVLLSSISPFLDGAPLPFSFSYELGNFRYLMFALQVGGASTVGLVNSYLDTLPTSLICVANTQMEILAHKIMNIQEQTEDTLSRVIEDIVADKLKDCVLHHEAIIRLVEYIDKVFSIGTFTQFVGSAIIICNTLFRMVLIPFGTMQYFMLIVYLGLMLGEIFMYCWFGNEIIWKSTKLIDACYSTKWYHCSSKIRKYLFIIMERSKRPLRVNAFKFTTLSLSAFTTILQWSYSYFALLMRLYKKM